MAQIETWLKCDLKKPVKVQYLHGNLFSQDNQANLIGVELYDNGAEVTASGTVTANIIREDGATVTATGSVSGNKASVVLPAAAYAIPGAIAIIIKITLSGVVTTVGAVVGTVYRSSTDTPVDPGTIMPSIQTLISQIQTAVASIPADYSSLWTSLAPAFSTSTNYAAGQHVTNNGKVYRFNIAHTAGAWVASEVTEVKLGNEISDLKSAISDTTGVSRISYTSGAYIALNNSTADITSPTSSNDYSYAVIPCSEGDVFIVSGQGGTAPRVWGFIDSNNVVLMVSAPTITINDVRLTAPPDSAYLVLNTKADAVSYKGDFIPFVLDPISEQLSSSSDLVGACTNVYINRYSHAESAGNGYYTSGYIKVNAGQVYYITANRQGDNQYDTSLNLYNESKTFVSTLRDTYDGTEWCPSINGYVRLTGYGIIPKCITNGLFIRNELDTINPLKGKTLIWFGTSIPAGQKSTAVTVDGIYCFNNYPDMVGKLLDCNVINQAIGTSCARTGIQSNVTADDPMGVHGKQYEIATRALTQTLAEKHDFIDNWDTKWGPNGTLHLYNAPETLPDYQKNVILNSSYETLLTPYLDGTYEMPDYFIFDHGYNDGAYYGNPTTGAEMSVLPDDPNNRHYFLGALHMLFKMILEANPKAKILLIDHFCSQDRSWVIDAQKVLSEQWEFPTMELYKSSGISMQEIDVNGTPTTIKSIYCPDGTHPHSDSTGKTNMMIAKKLAKWLKQVV